MPGSRDNEINKLFPYLEYIYDYLLTNNITDYKIFIPTLPHLVEKLTHLTKDWKIETVISPALDTLKKFLKEGKKFDLVFIDADKGNYKNYYELSLNLINEKALIIFDNVLWHGDVFKKSVTDKQTNIMREFNKYIKNDNRVEKVILPLGDGLTICRKV